MQSTSTTACIFRLLTACTVLSFSSFVTYGNLPVEDHLKFLHDDVLSKADWIQPETVAEQPRWKHPVCTVHEEFISEDRRLFLQQTDEITSPIDPMSPPDRQAVVARGFITNRYEQFVPHSWSRLGCFSDMSMCLKHTR